MPAIAPLALDRSGPTGDLPVVLLHAGVADRRMWDPLWADLSAERDVVRLDLRGFGESDARPEDGWSHEADVVATLDALGIERAHLVGASMGAGVAVEVALGAARPGRVAAAGRAGRLADPADDRASCGPSSPPRTTRWTPGDLDAAAQANVDWWLVSPRRGADAVPAEARALVHAMQRRAFELTADWDDIEEAEPDPEPLERLGEITVPTLVLTGGLDLDAIGEAADAVLAGVAGARRTHWEDAAHLPSLDQPTPSRRS